jgi:nucleotide-binding universal stress UspA family protein
MDDYDHDISTASEAGDPKRIIVEYADEKEFDHIVLGVHGRPDEKRLLFGSIAEVVARRATVPVTLVR